MIRRICVTAALLAAGAIIGWAGSAGGTAKLAQAPAAAPAAPAFPAGRLIDLSHSFNERSIFWPTGETFRLDTVADGVTDKGYYYAANAFSAPSTAARTSTRRCTSPGCRSA